MMSPASRHSSRSGVHVCAKGYLDVGLECMVDLLRLGLLIVALLIGLWLPQVVKQVAVPEERVSNDSNDAGIKRTR
jgi:hypothetical protein